MIKEIKKGVTILWESMASSAEPLTRHHSRKSPRITAAPVDKKGANAIMNHEHHIPHPPTVDIDEEYPPIGRKRYPSGGPIYY